MAYTFQDFPTKKALKEAVESGQQVGVYQPGPFGPSVSDGKCSLEGPHYPRPHKWWATAQVKDGLILKGSVK